MNTHFYPHKYLLLAAAVCLSFGHITAEAVSLEFSNGNSSTVTAPGIKLNLADVSDLSASPVWKLTTFTWLSTRRSDAEPTGRGYLLIFDASKFDPAEKTYAEVGSEANGLIAVSSTYADGQYTFPDTVILERGKSYYILNSVPITTDRSPIAPHQYGFDTKVQINGIERLTGKEASWGTASSPGTPNFRASFEPATKSQG